jgi:hypothetical protein
MESKVARFALSARRASSMSLRSAFSGDLDGDLDLVGDEHGLGRDDDERSPPSSAESSDQIVKRARPLRGDAVGAFLGELASCHSLIVW